MRTLRGKLMVLLILAALAPLVFFGSFSLYNNQRSLTRSVEESFREITVRAAEEIGLFLKHSRELLETLAVDLAETNLSPAQQQRIIENYAIRFPQFLKIIVYNAQVEPIYSTSLRSGDPDAPNVTDLLKAKAEGFISSKPYLSQDLTPVLWFFVPMGASGSATSILAAQIDLLSLWKWVSEIRLGKSGYASIVSESGELIASGNPHYKRAILSSEEVVTLENFNASKPSAIPQVVQSSQGDLLLSAQKISDNPLWYLVFTQPTREAFALIRTDTILLIVVAFGVLFIMWLTGVIGTRRTLLKPVAKLIKATEEIGRGNLEYRIEMKGRDELGQLGASINKMGSELLSLEDTIRKQERMAMFGRMASGLAHDLKHPVKNIESAAKLMEEMYDNAEYRQTFTRVVQREFIRINQFLDDLRNVTHEMPYHPTHVDVIELLQEVVESFQAEARQREAKLTFKTTRVVFTIEGDPHLLRRLFENLVSNALQALEKPEGQVTVQVESLEDILSIEITDTGMGIPPERMAGLFNEFTTTKRKGLGLGLAIAKKIVQLHQGEIQVESRLGEGTTFKVTFPLREGAEFKKDNGQKTLH